MDILQPENRIPMPPMEDWNAASIPEKTLRQAFHFCLLATSKTLEEAEARTRTSRKTIASKCRELAKFYNQPVAVFSKTAVTITPFGAGLADAVYPSVKQFKELFEGVLNDIPRSDEVKSLQSLTGAATVAPKKRFSLW